MNPRTFLLYFKTLLVAMFINNNANSQANYIRKSTNDCIEYIKSKRLTIQDYSSISIVTRVGLVYKLPNGEVVLIPTNISEPYEGFINQDMKAFHEMKKTGYYPVDDNHMGNRKR